MHLSTTVSGLEKTGREPVFTPSSAFPVAQSTVSGSLTEQLTGLQQVQGVMTGYAFRDFLNYFLMQQPAPTGAIPPSAPPGNLLSTSGLQLDIQLERLQKHKLPEHNGQARTAQHQTGAEGLAGAMRMSTPELHTDGSMTYTVTLIKQTLRHEDLALQLGPLWATQTVGLVPLVQASASAGTNLQDFSDQAPYGDAWDEDLREYSATDLEALLSASVV